MRIRFMGTAAPQGWPVPECRCASCRRAASEPRRPLAVHVEGSIQTSRRPEGLAFDGGGPVLLKCDEPDPSSSAPFPGLADGERSGLGRQGPGASLPPDVVVVHADAPEAIGDLRRRGAVHDRTRFLLVGGGHGVHSPAELRRRAALWGAEPVTDGQVVEVAPLPEPVGPTARRVLVTGGARSGKSAEAERRMLAEPHVVYVATGPRPEGDAAWAERVAAHRSRRPSWWRTEETGDAAAALDKAAATGEAVLFDCAGTWLAGAMEECGMWSDTPPPDAQERLDRRIGELLDAWRRFPGHSVAVTNEVGSGVVPATRSGGLFRDMLGRLNQRLAHESDEVLLAVSGRIIELP
ncbi:bifunctional adenosylcobinamide kinase/adenosylcobinamide-phosphate guanylyltransferase [Nocardiopsis sp. RSe5-2]|uniref:Adenosylcobinamide kinase n=1 Tax=Nocardiopsis endophytica TaxID=3018445 RepID=A0ABT4UFG3_9ACTN|nr:bifunctional adenosylcobinamide kinase/adenosylcobinamide-phosphate guanylyltransferase [Nocardiopsis endophytica]MDA2815090.1 bifunctional adenosylcobinamide kinase/adenosylcobinamide-phosphate guanylyltransferase [Nocardiopsis endophytica]